ncbi:hypothetical protein DGG96_10670 [Legionella qingyii]|uniref:Uncharacterized protein n=1 Tax=Legionella qingyii TaxID=2184757 RepID=A0A317U0M2_9GAMM|nr:hypothetical protein DGG96_10670 [Legionella qingyii]
MALVSFRDTTYRTASKKIDVGPADEVDRVFEVSVKNYLLHQDSLSEVMLCIRVALNLVNVLVRSLEVEKDQDHHC